MVEDKSVATRETVSGLRHALQAGSWGTNPATTYLVSNAEHSAESSHEQCQVWPTKPNKSTRKHGSFVDTEEKA